MHVVDEEWTHFISSSYDDDSDVENYNSNKDILQEESESYASKLNDNSIPKPTDIYISTKTKITYLNVKFDLKDVFWKLKIIQYYEPKNGIIKKQIKFNSNTEEELNYINEKLRGEPYFDQYVITSINNPTGRIKFKDIRKITIGISKKDIMSYKIKQKSAFYNCFVMIIRLKVENMFKEFHVKVFNTGKLEIPGVQSENTYQQLLKLVIDILQPFFEETLYFDNGTTVLINSNFNCGFYINREILHDILKYKYNIQSIFDSCSYPGIQCKFYYNNDTIIQSGSQISEENAKIYKNVQVVSFMIFRTGSVLIVGTCDENILMQIYSFIKDLLVNEYSEIHQKNIVSSSAINKEKKHKLRKKNIIVSI